MFFEVAGLDDGVVVSFKASVIPGSDDKVKRSLPTNVMG